VSLFSFPSHIFACAPFIIIIIIIIIVYRKLGTIALWWLATQPNVRVMFRTFDFISVLLVYLAKLSRLK